MYSLALIIFVVSEKKAYPNCPGMIIGRSSTNFLFFYADRKFKMATTAGHRLTLDPMGKYSNAFFSETTNIVWIQLSKWFQRRSVLKHFSHRVQC
jgi:hypothetical protein